MIYAGSEKVTSRELAQQIKQKFELQLKLQQIRERKILAQAEVPQLLEERTVFDWFAQPNDSWAGISKEYLLDFVKGIAIFIGITNEQAKIIRVLFADHALFDEALYISFNANKYSSTTKQLLKSVVVLNRSLEILDIKMRGQTHHRKLPRWTRKDTEQLTPILYCELESPLEYIIWSIAEELCHAKLHIMAKTRQNDSQINNRFQEIRRKKNKNSSIVYENSYQEMTVARMCLRVLEHLCPPNRASYFRLVYQQSLKRSSRPIPKIENQDVIDSIFIPTGFRRRIFFGTKLNEYLLRELKEE